MKVKKLLSAIIAGAMVLGTMSISAFAADYKASVNGTNYTTLADAFAQLKDGEDYTIEILDDVDLTGTGWVSVSGNLDKIVINGNSHTITGLNAPLFGAPKIIGANITFNNIKIDRADINVPGTGDEAGAAAFVGWADAVTSFAFNDCHVTNSTITGGNYAAGLYGYASIFGAVTVDGCSVTGSTITGGGSTGAVAGHANGNGAGDMIITNTTIANNTITSNESNTSKIKAGSVCGTVGAAPISVEAEVSGNTVKSGTTEVTTVYGRKGSDGGAIEITGGTYQAAPLNEDDAFATLAEGLELKVNSDGTYTVAGKEFVAEVGEGKGYTTIEDAIAAAGEGTYGIVTYVLYDDQTITAKSAKYEPDMAQGASVVNVKKADSVDAVVLTLAGVYYGRLSAQGAELNVTGITLADARNKSGEGSDPDPWEFCYLETECTSATFTDCKFLEGVNVSTDTTFEDCTFTMTEQKYAGDDTDYSTDHYALWIAETGDIVVKDCVFENIPYGGIKSTYGYYGSTQDLTLTVTDTTFRNVGNEGNHRVIHLDGAAAVTATDNTLINSYTKGSDDANTDIYDCDIDISSVAVVSGNSITASTSTETYNEVAEGDDGSVATGFITTIKTNGVDVSKIWWTVKSASKVQTSSSFDVDALDGEGDNKIGLVVAGLGDASAVATAYIK